MRKNLHRPSLFDVKGDRPLEKQKFHLSRKKRVKNVRLADLNATGDQTSKCSDKQYKYEAKMSG